MADLAVPFLELYKDDDQAFVVFRAFMGRVRRNFLPGMYDIQRQMRLLGRALSRVDDQLHRHLVAVGAGNYIFAFQMLLLQLRREVSLPDTFTLWERMWASEELLTAARQGAQQQQQRRRRLPSFWSRRRSPASPAAPAAAPAASNQEQQRRMAKDAEVEGVAVAPSSRTEGGQAQNHDAAPAPDCPGAEDGAAAAAGSTERVDLCVYVVAAALRAQRKALLVCRSMEEVVQFVNRFPAPADVVALVRDAERIYRACEEGGGGRHRGPAAGGPAMGPLRILSGCWRPAPLPAPADGKAWAVAPCEAGI